MIERPSLLLPEVRLGRLHLERLRLLVIDGLADLEDIEEWPSVEPLLETLSAEVRRIVRSRRVDASLNELLQRQLPRARRWPEETFEDRAESAGPAPRIGVGTAPTDEARLVSLLHALRARRLDAGVRVRCRSADTVPWVSAALQGLGLEPASAEGWDVAARPPGGAEPKGGDRRRTAPRVVRAAPVRRQASGSRQGRAPRHHRPGARRTDAAVGRSSVGRAYPPSRPRSGRGAGPDRPVP